MTYKEARDYLQPIADCATIPGYAAALAKALEALEIVEKSTMDAVPVVRCRECIHYAQGVCLKIYDDGVASSYAWQGRNPDDFCSYGERKEDGA